MEVFEKNPDLNLVFVYLSTTILITICCCLTINNNLNFVLLFISKSVVRGRPTFDPVKYVKEVSHVEHRHADLLLIHPNFSSK